MLVSHSHKFIYIKTKKTASTSIQDYLEPYCEDGIVIKRDRNGHLPAEEIKALIGDEIWDSYKKIVPIRNPWDQMVSLYLFRSRKRSPLMRIRRFLQNRSKMNTTMGMDFNAYIKYLNSQDQLNLNFEILQVNGEIPDDYTYILYEDLHQNLADLCQDLKIDFESAELPFKKSKTRKGRNYQTFYSEETKELVEKVYRWEVQKFGYSFK